MLKEVPLVEVVACRPCHDKSTAKGSLFCRVKGANCRQRKENSAKRFKVARSAGLIAVSMYLHWLGSVISFFVNFHIKFLANHPYCLDG